jgi:glycosyltransferase involved in cell wall biosynthesis
MKQKRNLLYIGNKLAAHGKPPTTIDTLSVQLADLGYNVITSSSKKNKFLRLLDMVLTTLKHKNTAAFVLIDTYSTQNFYYAVTIASLCRFFKIPYIPILHGGNLPNRLKKSKSMSQKLFNGAKTNVVPSAYLLEQFKGAGYKKLTYIPNTVKIENYPFLLRKSVRPKLLWVRAFAEIYNPLLALQIVEQLKKNDVDVSLCMVGPDKDGTMQRCKKVVADLNLPITFMGKLEKENWRTLSKEYDIFINTTNFDNMPVSVMEAMALGLPIVSTDVGGIPYLVENGKNGITVLPNNPTAFVDAIGDLLDDPQKAQQLALKARSKVEAFDWQKIKHSWITLFDK